MARILRIAAGVATLLLVAAAFLIFYYYDYSDTLDNSVLLAKAVFHGQFSDFYHYAAQAAHPNTVYTANYNVFLYAIFAVWNAPILLLHKLTGFDYMQSVPALLWCKALIVAALAPCAYAVKKIVSLYVAPSVRAGNAGTLSVQLFLANSCVIAPALVTGQYDILSVLPMLWGIYFYLRGRQGWFIFFFALAVPLKMFAIFAFFPLLLLREKRIPCIALKTLPTLAINALCALPFSSDPWYALCLGSQNRDALNLILSSGFSVSGLHFNLFVALYLALCIWCYITPHTWDDAAAAPVQCYVPLFSVFAAFFAFVSCVGIRSYWVIWVVPFALFVVFFRGTYLRTNVLLFTLGTAAYTLHAFINHWIFSISPLVTRLALPYFISLPAADTLRYGSIANFLQSVNLSQYNALLRTVFVVALAALLVLNFPRAAAISAWRTVRSSIEGWYIWLQIGLTTALLGILLYANLATQPAAVIDLSSQVNGYIETNLTMETTLCQSFIAPADAQIRELTFVASNQTTDRAARILATFTLTDDSTGETVFCHSVGVALVQSGQPYTVSLGSISLVGGHTYTLSVQADIPQPARNSVPSSSGEQRHSPSLISRWKSTAKHKNTILLSRCVNRYRVQQTGSPAAARLLCFALISTGAYSSLAKLCK